MGSGQTPDSGHPNLGDSPAVSARTITRDRSVLPIPRSAVRLPDHVTYDAKDPETSFPPIEPLRPPESAPNVLVVLLDDVGFAASSAFGGPISTPNCGAARRERAQIQPLPHDRSLLADAPGPAHRTEPPRGGNGRHHRDRDFGSRLQLDSPEHVRAARRDAEAERLLDRAVRQVPRGAGLGDEPYGAVQRVAHRLRLRALLRLHRRRDEPVRARDLPRHGAGRAGQDGGGGLPLHRGHDGSGDRLDQASRKRSCQTSPSSSTSRLARRTLHITCGRNGRTSTRASSTTAGTRCASGRSPVRRSSA